MKSNLKEIYLNALMLALTLMLSIPAFTLIVAIVVTLLSFAWKYGVVIFKLING